MNETSSYWLSADIANCERHLSSINFNTSAMQGEMRAATQAAEESAHNLGVMIHQLQEFRMEQYMLNTERNEYLKGIYETLKAPNKTEAQELYEMAMELVRREDVKKSIDYFEKAIQLNPLHYQAYIGITLAYMKMGKNKEGLTYAYDSLKHAPQNEKYDFLGYSYQLIAKNHFYLHQYDLALESIQKSIQSKRFAKYYYDQGKYYLYTRNIEAGCKSLQNAIRGDRQYFNYALVDPEYNIERELVNKCLETVKKNQKENVDNLSQCITNITFVTGTDIERISNNVNIKEAVQKVANQLEEKRGQYLHKINEQMAADAYIDFRQAEDTVEECRKLINASRKYIVNTLENRLSENNNKVQYQTTVINRNKMQRPNALKIILNHFHTKGSLGYEILTGLVMAGGLFSWHKWIQVFNGTAEKVNSDYLIYFILVIFGTLAILFKIKPTYKCIKEIIVKKKEYREKNKNIETATNQSDALKNSNQSIIEEFKKVDGKINWPTM
ncbi:Uncharacterized protein BWINRASL_01837 [Bacillus mycoides]|nr:hypothetical protein IEQ_01670 [Bacillus cereus BAG6X1-2]SCM94018.1 Uncharacterized protein BWINRASL_01837 [Bacillus mycoides]